MKRLFRISIGTLSLLASVFLTSNAMAHSHSHSHSNSHHHCPVLTTPSFGAFITTSITPVDNGAPILLSTTQAVSVDVSLNSSNGVITLNTPGFYYVDFGASQSSGGEPLEVQLAIGGEGVIGAILASNPAPAGLLSASTIIHAESGTLLTLINANAYPLYLGNGVEGTPTAYVTLYRISQ